MGGRRRDWRLRSGWKTLVWEAPGRDLESDSSPMTSRCESRCGGSSYHSGAVRTQDSSSGGRRRRMASCNLSQAVISDHCSPRPCLHSAENLFRIAISIASSLVIFTLLAVAAEVPRRSCGACLLGAHFPTRSRLAQYSANSFHLAVSKIAPWFEFI